MQTFLNQHPVWSAFAFVIYFVALWTGVGFIIGLVSGWHSLAERYKTDRMFPDHKRRMRSAKMRFSASYNNVLTLASDLEGLYLGVFVVFRVGHPPLFVPWSEIQVDEPKRYFFLMSRMFYLGPNRVPFRIREPLAQFLLQPRGGSNAPTPGTISSSF